METTKRYVWRTADGLFVSSSYWPDGPLEYAKPFHDGYAYTSDNLEYILTWRNNQPDGADWQLWQVEMSFNRVEGV